MLHFLVGNLEILLPTFDDYGNFFDSSKFKCSSTARFHFNHQKLEYQEDLLSKAIRLNRMDFYFNLVKKKKFKITVLHFYDNSVFTNCSFLKHVTSDMQVYANPKAIRVPNKSQRDFSNVPSHSQC